MDTFRLNMSICNNCFVLKLKRKQPYFLTQCAHIFCQDCWQKANNHCTLCGNNEVVTMELSEHLPPKVRPLFEPLAETLKTFSIEMLRIDEFRNNQLKITMQRFMELEKKYDILKSQYWTMRQDMKVLTRKFMTLRFEKDKLEKKLPPSQIQRDPSRRVYSTIQTPATSSTFNYHNSSGYFSESMGPRPIWDRLGSQAIWNRLGSRVQTPVQSMDPRKQHKAVDNFRVPSNARK